MLLTHAADRLASAAASYGTGAGEENGIDHRNQNWLRYPYVVFILSRHGEWD
eukprot:SAG25_NODE_44_length_19254_cov_246.998121_22_plen_52_part_00